MKILAMDQLANGTLIQVQNELGHVVSSSIVDGHPVGKIALHIFQPTHKISKDFGRMKYTGYDVLPKSRGVNYSFINVVDQSILLKNNEDKEKYEFSPK